ncbi:MAG: DNA polymerase III subunit gamma/tau [Anaerolineales bacterium]|nr:DNA polymerase III subunit gamma/tau [Anaerolineales bacterium]
MPAQALYRKRRPQLWDEVVGQEHVVQTLRNALRTDHVAHAYLFAGPRGCGKTTSARLVAKAVNCLHPDPAQRPDNTCPHCVAVTEGRFLDLIEIDGASNNSVESIRELRDNVNFAPSEGRYRVYIIDEVHMLSIPAFNALLKTLEEPPPHVIFILATTETHKIPATISSRCQRFEFRRIPVNEIVRRLRMLCAQEGLQVEDAALELMARQATGALRDAESLLDQLAGAGQAVSLAQVQELLGTGAGAAVQGLAEALAARDLTAGLEAVNQALDAGADPRQLARQMVDHLRQVLLVRLGSAALVEAPAELRPVLARQAERMDPGVLVRAVRAFSTAGNEARGGWQPQLPLELAVVECLTEPAAAGEPPGPQPAQPRAAPPVAEAFAPARSEAPRPTPPAARPARSAPPAPVGGSASGDLKAAWKRLTVLMKERDKPTEALLNSCTVIALETGVLRLATNEFVYKKINTEGTRAAVENLLAEVLGEPCRVKFEVTTSSKRVRGARADDIPEDGMVATALDLGGEIVEE